MDLDEHSPEVPPPSKNSPNKNNGHDNRSSNRRKSSVTFWDSPVSNSSPEKSSEGPSGKTTRNGNNPFLSAWKSNPSTPPTPRNDGVSKRLPHVSRQRLQRRHRNHPAAILAAAVTALSAGSAPSPTSPTETAALRRIHPRPGCWNSQPPTGLGFRCRPHLNSASKLL
jgi:hypothetical protein